MKKTKLDKGITLIVLIITIVVLLILAVVTIGAIQKSGIIAHAQNAASTYKTKADKENTILEWYVATIEDNLPGTGNEGDNDSSEEILWSYIDYGDDYYGLHYIGNDTELELTEDKEVKAYPGIFNEDTEEYEYDESKIITVKLSQPDEISSDISLEKLTVGEIAKNCVTGAKEVIVLGDFINIPDYSFDEAGIENLVIQYGVESVGIGAFHKNDLKSLMLPASITSIGNLAFGFSRTENGIINYSGTKEQWDKIQMDVTTAFGSKNLRLDIKVIFNDGSEMVI